jgi:hypothetical protein
MMATMQSDAHTIQNSLNAILSPN